MSSRYIQHHKKRSNNKHLCGRRVHVEKDMVTASVIRVRGGCGNMRVRINGQAMNQFVQLTLLEISSSLTESVKMEFKSL